MTEKQALQAALTHLQQTNADPEIIRVLTQISDELPLAKWTEASIRDAVKAFGRNNLPSVTVFKQHYNMRTGEWLEQNYSVRANRKQKMLDDFIENYNRIQPGTAHEYDTKKSPGSACVKTLLRDHDCSSWAELLAKFNLPVYPPRSLRRNTDKLKVTIYCDEL